MSKPQRYEILWDEETRLLAERAALAGGHSNINTYLHPYADRNMGLGLSSTFVLPYKTRASENHKYEIAAFYTLAHQSLVSDSVPTTKNLPATPHR